MDLFGRLRASAVHTRGSGLGLRWAADLDLRGRLGPTGVHTLRGRRWADRQNHTGSDSPRLQRGEALPGPPDTGGEATFGTQTPPAEVRWSGSERVSRRYITELAEAQTVIEQGVA